MSCSLIKTTEQFYHSGCENCDSILHLQHDQERILECTTSQFHGCIGLIKGGKSWVGKWQRIQHFVPGMYAIQIQGQLPIDVQEQLLEKGIKYRARDGSALE